MKPCTLLSCAVSGFLSLVAWVWLLPQPATACTNILVTRGASADGSTLVTYSADSHTLYGNLEYFPGGQHAPGTLLDIYEGDTGRRLGAIPQAPKTYTVVSYLNERQVAMGETTFGGREELVDPNGVLDYVSLMRLGLQRADTARGAIRVMTELVAQHGYASEGESISVSDPKEVWLFEIVGRGPEQRGALWVARRVPEGSITAHANQARIRTFPLNDPANCFYSPDVISFARDKGWFKGRDEEFSFADAYNPMTFDSLRACEARVWNVFRRAAPSTFKVPVDMFLGKAPFQPLPLFIVPDRKLGVRDVMALMRDHFQDTPLDLSRGVGAGPFNLPYRWRPLTWKLDGKEYINERAISTQQTGYSFVTQSRMNLPDPIGGVIWFGVDDTASTVYLPFYAGLREVPHAFRPGVGDLHHFTWDSAFWVFNWVSNWGYTRYSAMSRDIQVVQQELEGDFLARQPEVEAAAVKLHAQSPELARDYLTAYTKSQVERTMARWRKLGEELFVRYLDGNVKDELGQVRHPPFPEEWYRRVVQESGDLFQIKHLPGEERPAEPTAEAKAPPRPTRDPQLTGLSFGSREELGPMAAAVPADFPWAAEKLLLVPGTAQCGQLPRCCLSARDNPADPAKLIVNVPAEPAPAAAGTPAPATPARCGVAGWLVRVRRDERRTLQPEFLGHGD